MYINPWVENTKLERNWYIWYSGDGNRSPLGKSIAPLEKDGLTLLNDRRQN